MTRPRVSVVGGGNIGSSLAFDCALRGQYVTVIEKDESSCEQSRTQMLKTASYAPCSAENRKFKRTFLLPKAFRQDSRSSTEPALGSICRRLKADPSAEVRLSKGLPWGFPLQSAAKPRL